MLFFSYVDKYFIFWIIEYFDLDLDKKLKFKNA